MQTLTQGHYSATNFTQVNLGGLIITKSCYTEAFTSDWHSHEHMQLTLVLKGGCREKRKLQEFDCTPGMLLLYPCFEPHINTSYARNSKNFHIGFEDSSFKKYGINTVGFEGQCLIKNPLIKCGLLNLIAELNVLDKQSEISLDTTLLAIISLLPANDDFNSMPNWVKELKELLHDEMKTDWSLNELSTKINIHPVTISKYFPKYFHSNIGDYIRKIKIEKTLPILLKKNIAINDIAINAGFVDNAHYTRVFKKHTGITPSRFREFIIR